MMFQTLLLIFAVIGIGWVSVRSGYLDQGAVAPAAQIVLRIALPAMIFLALAGTPVGQSFDLSFLLAYGVASLMVLAMGYGLALALGLSRAEAAVIALGVSMANSAFMGLPIAQAVFGQDMAIRVFAHVLIVENLLILPLALLALALADEDGTARRDVLRMVFRNPLMIALLAGAAVSALGVTLPAQVADVLDLLGRLSAPLALLVIGGMLASLPASGQPATVGLIVTGKLFVHPLLVWLGVTLVPGVSPAMVPGGVLFAAMPMITIFPLLSARVGQGKLAALGLMVATTVSFVTLPAVLYTIGLAQP